MSIILGLNAKTAYNTGTTASPTWVIYDNVKTESLNIENALADATTRAANGWRVEIPTLARGSVQMQSVYDPADTTLAAIRTAALDKSMLLFGFFDGDPTTNGTQGLIGGWGVSQFNLNRDLEDVVMVDITLSTRENDAGNSPSWVTISV